MHSKIIALAVAGSSASAFVLPRDDGCTFEVTASGGKSGTIGQLGDGQNRIGGGLAPATYHISNGGITDANGRGCILTPPTTQWQCDVGATPTTGFSISSSGEIEYNGSGKFYACGASSTEYNIYTVPVKDQKDCVQVTLSSGGKCTGNGSGGSASSSSASKSAKPTETEESSAPAWTGKPTSPASWNETESWSSTEKPSPATTSHVRLTTSTVYTTTVDTITSCAATVTDCPAESQSTVLITKTIAVSTTICPVTETEKTPPASWETKPSPPASWESKPSPPVTWESQPSPPATWESKPSPPATWESKPSPPATWESKPTPPASQGSKPAPPASQESKPAPPASYESKPWAPASAPAASAPAASAPAASAPAASVPASSPAAPAECQPTTVYVTVTKEAPLPEVQGPASSAAPSAPAESSNAAAPPAGSSKASPPPAATAPSSKTPPSESTAKPAASSPATPAAHGSACQTSLTGAYQTPHLIVPISSEHPDWAYGTSYNGQINSTTSTIFNFDMPQEYKGKQCSLIFLFPNKKDLETSSYEFSGSGSLDVTALSSAANQKTSWSNAPSVKKDLGSIEIQPGNSYVVATGDCQAGTTQSIELSSKGGLSLNFFEDWNPSPLGLFITSC